MNSTVLSILIASFSWLIHFEFVQCRSFSALNLPIRSLSRVNHCLLSLTNWEFVQLSALIFPFGVRPVSIIVILHLPIGSLSIVNHCHPSLTHWEVVQCRWLSALIGKISWSRIESGWENSSPTPSKPRSWLLDCNFHIGEINTRNDVQGMIHSLRLIYTKTAATKR